MGETVMTDEICKALLWILIFFGMAAIGYCGMLRLLRSDRKKPFFVVIPLTDASGAVEQLYAEHLRRQLLGDSGQCGIVALDLGLSENEKRKCAQFCSSTQGMHLCTPQEFLTLVQTTQKEQ